MGPGGRAWLALVAGTWLVALTACGGPSYQLKLKPFSYQAVDFPLPSGLRLVFIEDHSQPSVAVASVVGSGGTSDPAGKEGLAHLVEHLSFRALHRGQRPVMDVLKDLGGVFNAYTSKDHTLYFTIAPRDSLVQLLRMEALRLMHPLPGVTEEVFATEREVVRNEKRQRTEILRAGALPINQRVLTAINRLLFPAGHAYHRTLVGSDASLGRLTLADARAFVRQHYRPANTTIVVAGNFKRSELKQIIGRSLPPAVVTRSGKPEQKFELREPTQRQVKRPPLPAPRGKGLKRITGPVSNPTLYLAWSLPGDYQQHQWQLMSTVAMTNLAMARTFRPRFHTSADRVEQALCFLVPGLLASSAICAIEVTPGQDPAKIYQQALDGLYQQWSNPRLDLQTADRVQSAFFGLGRSAMMIQLLQLSVGIDRVMIQAPYVHHMNRIGLFSDALGGIGSTAAGQVRGLAHKYLNRERAVGLLVEPARGARASSSRDSSASWPGDVFNQAAQENKRFAKLSLEAIQRTAVAPDTSKLRSFSLPSGLRVVLKRHGWAPFVRVDLYTRGGLRTSSPAGLADLVQEQHDAQPPMKVAGRWTRTIGPDHELVGVSAPSGNLPEALHLLRERVSSARHQGDRPRLERTLGRLTRQASSQGKDPEVRARRQLYAWLLPRHPMGRQVHDFAALKRLDSRAYERWLWQRLAPANAALVVVGDLNLAQAEAQVRRVWGEWRAAKPGKPRALLAAPTGSPPGKLALLLDRPGVTQARVLLGCRMAPATAKNHAARQVLRTLLREDFWQAVREKTGAAYQVSVSSAHHSGGVNLLQVESYIKLDQLTPALGAVLGRLSALSQGRVNRAALLKAKWTVARRSRIANLYLDQMVRTLVRRVHHGWPLAGLADFPGQLARVAPRDLARLLAPCAGYEVITVVGPRDDVGPALEALWQQGWKGKGRGHLPKD